MILVVEGPRERKFVFEAGRHANADVNGDGLSCWVEAPEGGGVFTVIDNVVARP